MLRTGDRIENPRTGQRMTFLTTSGDSGSTAPPATPRRLSSSTWLHRGVLWQVEWREAMATSAVSERAGVVFATRTLDPAATLGGLPGVGFSGSRAYVVRVPERHPAQHRFWNPTRR